MNNLKTEQIQKLIGTALAFLILLLILSSIYLIKEIFVGEHKENVPGTITVSATGETKAIPNIATFSFAVIATGKDVDEAQSKMAEVANKAIDYLKSEGIDEKDIQTTEYSANPQYDFSNGKQTLINYTARENVTVKVKDSTRAGKILSGVGGQGVSELSNLSFESDNKESLRQQARIDAINKAKAKAKELEDQVGFRLGRIVGFSEDYQQEGGPVPYYDRAVSNSQAVVPDIQTGENTVTSFVTIIYEIR